LDAERGKKTGGVSVLLREGKKDAGFPFLEGEKGEKKRERVYKAVKKKGTRGREPPQKGERGGGKKGRGGGGNAIPLCAGRGKREKGKRRGKFSRKPRRIKKREKGAEG